MQGDIRPRCWRCCEGLTSPGTLPMNMALLCQVMLCQHLPPRLASPCPAPPRPAPPTRLQDRSPRPCFVPSPSFTSASRGCFGSPARPPLAPPQCSESTLRRATPPWLPPSARLAGLARYAPRRYVVASTDKMSHDRVAAAEEAFALDDAVRSRLEAPWTFGLGFRG